jgi:hypothetical protein
MIELYGIESYQKTWRINKRGGIMKPAFQFIIVLVVVIGVLFLTYTEKLRAQDATTLIGMIVGYLLGKET